MRDTLTIAKTIYGRIYPYAPIALQNAAISTVGWHNEMTCRGRGFSKWLNEFEAKTYATPQEVIEYRDARLRAFLAYAYETTPFYRELFDDAGLHPRELVMLEDLAALPILSKATVQERRRDFMSSGVPKRRWKTITTSGSTGSGFTVATTIEAVQEQWAIWWRYWRWHGIPRNTQVAILGTSHVVPGRQEQPPFWRYDRGGRQIIFSTHHTSAKNIEYYVSELRRRKPQWLHGYSSQITLIASYLIETRTDLGYGVRWITTSAENLLPQQANLIEKAFGVRPKQHYGLVEATGNMSECEKGKLHGDEEFGTLEFIPISGSLYRVVGTNVSNPAMPLIRYDCDDHVTIERGETCSCGRPGRVVTDIDGRREDYVVLKNGLRLGKLANLFFHFPSIREAQIRQEKIGDIRFLINRGRSYAKEDEVRLRKEIVKWVRDGSKITIEYVDVIERTKRGKLRLVVSSVPAEEAAGFEVLPPPSLSALEKQ